MEEVELSLPKEEDPIASTEDQQQQEDLQPVVEESQGAANGSDGGETTGDEPKSSDSVPTVSLEVEKTSSAGKLSRIEEEKEEELARFVNPFVGFESALDFVAIFLSDVCSTNLVTPKLKGCQASMSLVLQWNPSITDTIGNQHFVPYSEVSLT